MKYLLTIEGTREEIEICKKNLYEIHSQRHKMMELKHFVTPEFKIVEPFRLEFETTVDELGRVNLTNGREHLVYQMTMNESGKRVKVIIEEINE